MTDAEYGAIMATYSAQRTEALDSLGKMLLPSTDEASAKFFCSVCSEAFDAGVSAAHDRSLHWHYIADGDLPDADIALILAIRHNNGDEWIATGSYLGEGQWLDERSHPLNRKGRHVYAWAEEPATPTYRAPS